MKIKYWLYSMIFALTIGLMSLFLLTQSANNTQLKVSKLALEVEKLEIEMLTLRRHEKDFLARLDVKYQDRFNSTIDDLKVLSTSVDQHAKELELAWPTQDVSKDIEAYKNNFNSIVVKFTELGLSRDNGLINDFLKQSDAIEKELDLMNDSNATKYFLKLKNATSDYLANPSSESEDKYQELEGQLDNYLNGLSFTNISIIKSMIDVDSSIFEEIKEIEHDIGISENEGLKGDMRSSVHDLETLLHEEADKMATTVESISAENARFSVISFATIAVFLLGALVFVSTLISKRTASVSGLLESLNKLFEDKKYNELLNYKSPDFNDEFGQIAKSIFDFSSFTAKQAQDIEKSSKESLRIKNALDVCDTSVMVADNDMTIIYTNKAVEKMMIDEEKAIKEELPMFNAHQLIGTSVHQFHKNPDHQRGLVGKLQAVYKTNIKVNGITFGLIATPLFDDNGERLGSVVEWENKTEALAQQEKDLQISNENFRIKQALDVCNTSVMVADPDLNIIYLNQSTQKMMSDAESDIKTALPNFNASELIGTNIDGFHVNPAHQRGMLKGLDQTYTAGIKVGPLDMQVVATPINNEKGERLGYAVEWQNQTEELARQKEELKIADANARIKQALDNVTTNAMIADNDRNIVYMNKSVTKMMKSREGVLKEVLPNFNADNLLNERIDVFHKNPAHQENLLRNLTSTYATEIVVNGLTFSLIANPVFDENNTRIGSVVEWKDRTEEVIVEQEIDQLVETASNGDLTTRIDLKGKDGFFEKLGVGLNRLLGISEGVVNDTARVLDALAHGDLSQKIDQDYQGSFGKLKRDANATVDKLTEIISSIRDAASSVSTGADEIAQGNTDLSQRTEEQASSLEETASSMEEMTSTVRQSADNAGKANSLSREAAQKAQEGGNVVKEAVTAMAEINASSKKISDIIGVIDEIAFQTNLLALNAAVEAARAGEQGRGFAVVAGEVRSLAQRSAGAAKEIKDLIRDSGEKVDAGTDLVNKSGETLKDIVDSVQKVSSMIADITDASEEQASGIDQVNKAVSQMDEMTQQNAALVEEATSAGEAMSEQARGMMAMMKFFSADGSAKVAVGQSYQAPVSAPQVNRSASTQQPQTLRKPMEDPNDQWQEF